jgi:ATP-binding cassette subfamily B protein
MILPGARELPSPVQGAIRFDDVTFSYGAPAPGADDPPATRPDPHGPAPVLRDFSLEVPAGETHAIVGATGAGKSTVIKLLLRLYEATAGSISVDGVKLADLTLASLRGSIGFVAQDVYLFQGTVRDNLALGRPDATDEQILAAADLAEARGFIEAMPHGLDTVVGERGQKLSGGQRQRLTIARAILTEPAILVLDEATSAVDNETEAAIQRSLQKVAVGRTTLVVAHRLSTIRHAHRIHVMEAGEVVEAGTHEELVALGGLYSALWKVQTGEAT